jgi:hypothetical protein
MEGLFKMVHFALEIAHTVIFAQKGGEEDVGWKKAY